MASRHIKRLQKEDLVAVNNSDEHGFSSDPDSPAPAAEKNLFSLLTEEDDVDGVQDEESDDEKAEDSVSQKTPQPASSSKKKKKKKKGRASEQPASEPKAQRKDSEDLDELLKSMNIQLRENVPEQSAASTSTASSVLRLDFRKLKAEDELRKIFGSKVINETSREEDEGRRKLCIQQQLKASSYHRTAVGVVGPGASRRVRRMAQRGLLKQVPLKDGVIISPRYDWPKPDGSLRMERDTESRGKNCFRYVYSSSYKEAEELFMERQRSHDPNQIIGLLQQYPYHVLTLLTVSDLYRASGQHETADDFLARSLYALEMAWHPHFQLGSCTLECDLPENITLFRALFAHIRSLIKRGLYSTALENAKALYTLNPHDPFGILHCMDYIALKAGEYGFILRFCVEQDPGGKKFAFFPNWMFSNVLSKVLENLDYDKTGAELSQEQVKRRKMQDERNKEHARVLVLVFPDIVQGICEKLKESGHQLPKVPWEDCLARLEDLPRADHPTKDHLMEIYVERQYSLYKNPAVLKWLETAMLEAFEDETARRQARQVEAVFWPKQSHNQFHYLRLSAYSDHDAALPQEELEAVMQNADQGQDDFPMPEYTPDEFRETLDRILNDPEVEPGLRERCQRMRDDPNLVPRIEEFTRLLRAGEIGGDGELMDLLVNLAVRELQLQG